MTELKTITIRFYEELNDFLSAFKKKVPFEYEIKEKRAVKDVIEAIGIPHIEIDVILVNGKSVDFKYILQDGDYVSVYPEFELLDISNVTKLKNRPLRITKFILDVHLGKLAKWLRLLGFDTFYEKHLDDTEIISISLKEKRIILTRDKGILKHNNITHGYWIRSQNPKKQLEQVINKFDLRSKFKPFSRCIICNGIVKSVKKEDIIKRIEPATQKYYENFYQCGQCKKIYWEGSHYEKMEKLINSIIKGQDL